MSESAVLILVRHGETSANLDGVWHGSTDTSLTPRGRQQAERVAGYLRAEQPDASALYSSDLQRARHTAEPIANGLGLSLRLDVDLREFDLGGWEGRSFAELFEVERFWHHMARDPHYAPHGGESPLQVTQRITGVLRRIAVAHPGERVIVVAHGGALSMALAELVDGHYTQWKRVMDNCAVSELVIEPEPSLLRFNHTEHLADL